MLKTALKVSALAVAAQIVEAEERTGRDKYRSLNSRSRSGGRSRSRDQYAYAEIFAATANGSEVSISQSKRRIWSVNDILGLIIERILYKT